MREPQVSVLPANTDGQDGMKKRLRAIPCASFMFEYWYDEPGDKKVERDRSWRVYVNMDRAYRTDDWMDVELLLGVAEKYFRTNLQEWIRQVRPRRPNGFFAGLWWSLFEPKRTDAEIVKLTGWTFYRELRAGWNDAIFTGKDGGYSYAKDYQITRPSFRKRRRNS